MNIERTLMMDVEDLGRGTRREWTEELTEEEGSKTTFIRENTLYIKHAMCLTPNDSVLFLCIHSTWISPLRSMPNTDIHRSRVQVYIFKVSI